MQPEFHEFQIGEKTFQAVKMNAFAAAKHLTRLKVLLDKGLAQSTNASAVQLLAGIDENTLENVILPMLKDAAVTSITDGKKIDSPSGLNSVFSADTLFDFYELTWEVLKLNFSPFFSKVLSLFGLSPEELAGRVKNLAKVQSQEH